MPAESYHLNLGESALIMREGSIHILGIGSCIGLFLHDRVAAIAAACHVVYPHHTDPKLPCSNANMAVEVLISQLIASGAKVRRLQAHIIGGANLLSLRHDNIGQENTQKVESKLKEYGITIVTKEVGDKVGRSASFFLPSGQLQFRTLRANR